MYLDALLKPMVLGNLQLKNSIIMAPLTRAHAGAGLIIAEATMI